MLVPLLDHHVAVRPHETLRSTNRVGRHNVKLHGNVVRRFIVNDGYGALEAQQLLTSARVFDEGCNTRSQARAATGEDGFHVASNACWVAVGSGQSAVLKHIVYTTARTVSTAVAVTVTIVVIVIIVHAAVYSNINIVVLLCSALLCFLLLSSSLI